MSGPMFTPGPWKLWCDERDGAFEITAALPDGCCGGMLVVQRGGMPSRLPMAQANARLIAAAPELYGLGERTATILSTYTEGTPQHQLGTELLTLLARVRGQ